MDTGVEINMYMTEGSWIVPPYRGARWIPGHWKQNPRRRMVLGSAVIGEEDNFINLKIFNGINFDSLKYHS